MSLSWVESIPTMRNCTARYGMLCRQQASECFLVSQAIELVVSKYKSKFES